MADHAGHDGLLDVEAVFGLLEDGVGVLLENLLGDFLAAVGGEAVQDDDVASFWRYAQVLRIALVWTFSFFVIVGLVAAMHDPSCAVPAR